MKRRTLLVGLGGVATACSTIVSTGAFTRVSADRRISVNTSGDNDAFLALSQRGSSKYTGGGRASETGTPETVEFSFPSLGERLNDEVGLGADSVYEFDRDAGESARSDPIEGLLRIKNQGTERVEVYSKHQRDSELEIELYDIDDSERQALRDNPTLLDVGEYVDVGFRIRTFGAEAGEFNEILTIVAEALS